MEKTLTLQGRYFRSALFFGLELLASGSFGAISHGALLYDATQPNGPNSTVSNDPGQWITNIQQFNGNTPLSRQITRLYPYSGDIKITCTDPNACIYSGAGQNVFVGYNSPAFGQASVAAYRAAFPKALILAIIDADTTSLPLLILSYVQVGKGIATELTRQICNDPNVDGVFFDLEPFNFNVNQGQYTLYQQTALNFSSAACIDATHPNGRTMAIYMNPNNVTNWSVVPGMLSKNGYLVVAAYDVDDTTPPRPTPYSLYSSSVTGKIQAFMDPNSTQYKIPYTIAIPAAASFSEFEEFGYYDTSYPMDFRVDTDFRNQGFTQLAYIQSAVAIIQKNAKSGYFMGTDYWSWSQYKSPAPHQNQLLLPNIPPANVIQYLQQNG